MKAFDSLVIVGDSFCKDRSQATDWPVLLGQLLQCRILGRGWGGNAWWSTRNTLLQTKHNKSTSILIVIHTEPGRLPNDFNIPANPGLLFSKAGSDSDELKNRNSIRETAAAFYNSDLFSLKFYAWAQQAWIKELDADTEYYATIHIPAFDSVDLTSVKNGIVVIPGPKFASLRALSNREVDSVTWSGPDSRSNHFKDANNINFATALSDIISSLVTHDTGERNFSNLQLWDFTQQPFCNS